MELQTWEWLSYVVTVIGLPLAITIFSMSSVRRNNEEEEVYQPLSDNYHDFLKVVLANHDLDFYHGKAPRIQR